jgi:hypothetical protein
MNDRDMVDLYSQRREEYVALKERVASIKQELGDLQTRQTMTRSRDLQMQADILCRDFHRVQDSMLFLEGKVCSILPKYRPEN